MKRALSILMGTALATALLAPASAQESTSPIDCGRSDARETLTAEGLSFEFESPRVAAPELAATHEVTGDVVTPHRTASFYLTVDVAPSTSALVDARLQWSETSDFDIFVFDAEGFEIARSADSNIDGGDTKEERTAFEVRHCDDIYIAVRNWAGRPQPLSLSLSVTPGEELLVCTENDAAPGCAGKTAGEPPDPAPDERSFLYLGGDPGNVSMVGPYVSTTGQSWPFASSMTAERPTSGTPNSHTRLVAGFRDQYQNPFVPHFTHFFEEPQDIQGDVGALLWLSSRTMDATGEFYVDLYVDGIVAGSVKHTGEIFGPHAAPLFVTFEDVDFENAESVTLQYATPPAASSSEGAGNPAHAEVTTYYGSVQYPSRITLP